ncbi:hypothetical protein FRB90_004435 [Tulasnella sp. 427]|nr:hypothetical protein FRB90_004435 [Tulasnella sp. 427]
MQGNPTSNSRQKRVAVVGGGPAGLAFLRVFRESGLDWEVVLFEARDEVGGVWYRGSEVQPDPQRTRLPASPIYDSLTTNLPVNVMAYHDYQFPPGTALFPPAAVVQQYLVDFAENFGLRPSVRFQTRVEEARWTESAWNIRVSGKDEVERFDHLVVANGHYNKPYEAEIPGLQEWSGVTEREVLHSTWYREPSAYVGKRVLVIGGGPSGRDLSLEIAQVSAMTYHAVKGQSRNDSTTPRQRPAPARFEATGSGKAVYADGSVDEDVDVVILATGYEHNFPFLSEVIAQRQPPTTEQFPSHLWNSGAHVYPLARHIFPICDDFPPNSLAFIGLPSHVVPFPLCEAQAAATLRVFAHPESLDIEHEKELMRARNTRLRDMARAAGGDESRMMARHWHRISDQVQFEYRDELLKFADMTKWLTDEWLPRMYSMKQVLRSEWSDAVRSGEGEALVKNAVTKDDWYRVLEKLLDRAEKRQKQTAEAPLLESAVKPAGIHLV